MITTLYSTVCLCFEPLLTHHGRIARMKCVCDTMGQKVNAASSRSWSTARKPFTGEVFIGPAYIFQNILNDLWKC